MDADRAKLFFNLRLSAFLCGSLFLLFFACGSSEKAAGQVVLYTSVDQPIAAPIVRDFEKKTGIKVVLVTDTEATKSVGLAEKLRAEKANPQADVWWSNEIFHTIKLADEGVLDVYRSDATLAAQQEMPAPFRDDSDHWFCNGLRARVIVSPKSAKPIERLEQLADASLKGKIAMARPTAGTTGGHVAAMYVQWGDEKADAFFRALRANGIKLVGGNSVVAELASQGTIQAGLSDNDDAVAAGENVVATKTDQSAGGTLAVPTSVALVKGAPHKAEAGKLIDYLISFETEQQLIKASFAAASIRDDPPAFKWIEIDYHAVAKKMPEAVRRTTAILEGRQ